MKNFRILAVTAASLLSAAALAQSPVKENPPVPAPPRDFALPALRQFVLDNGLRVTLVNYGNTPKVNVGLYVAAGNSYESASEVWLGDLTAQLMREGTATKTGPEISLAAARMGGQVDINVGDDTASVTGSALSEFAPELAKLVADLALHPKFPAGELEFINFHGLPADYLNTYVGKVRAVTKAMVQEMTRKYIDDSKTAIIAVGDRKQIEDQVRPYGPTGSTHR